MALPHQAKYSSFLFVYVFICALCSCSLYALYATLTLLCMLHQPANLERIAFSFRSFKFSQQPIRKKVKLFVAICRESTKFRGKKIMSVYHSA